MWWVLSWGGGAEAIAPPELREALKAELDQAAQRHERPGLASAGRNGCEGSTARRNKVTSSELRRVAGRDAIFE
jgi:hypothetical protein